jgi:hypothetical protein
MRRILKVKLFLGSTLEEVEVKIFEWLSKEKICVGNYIDIKLSKLGDVYQLILIYAELIQEQSD